MTEANAGAVVQWQYSFLTKQTESYLLTEMNILGSAGWEVIAINYAKDLKGIWQWTAWMKRPSTAAQAGDAIGKKPTGAVSASGAKQSGQALQGFDLSDGDFGFKAGE